MHSAPQKPEPNGKIAEIRATGSKRYAEADIVAACGLKVGDVVGREELQAAANRLANLGPLSSVRYRFTSKGEDLAVEFQVEDAPTVPVWFDNFPWFTDGELTEGIKHAVALFDGTAPQQGAILDTMTDALQQMLASRGVKASVEHALIAAPGSEQMILSFSLAGANLTVSSVQFGDALASESPRLRDRVSDLVGKPYSRIALALFASEQVQPVYLEKGYLRARIGPPSARFTGSPTSTAPPNLVAYFPIEPGPVYHWAGIEWVGNPANKATLDALVPLKPGDAADGVLIEGLWKRVEDEYGKYGYLDAKVTAQPLFDDAAKTISYRVVIAAGVAYHMADLVITGLSVPAEQKVREAWRIPRGQIFDSVYFDEFLATGLKQAFGDYPVHYDKVGHLLRTHPETATVDVLLDFQ